MRLGEAGHSAIKPLGAVALSRKVESGVPLEFWKVGMGRVAGSWREMKVKHFIFPDHSNNIGWVKHFQDENLLLSGLPLKCLEGTYDSLTG